MPNASQVFVKALENEGVNFIFGVPGEENIDFLEAVRTSGIRFVLTRHEQGAGFMADVYGRLTGKAGVCLSTLGPGASNLITPVADANLDRAPLVAITGQADILQAHKESHQYINVVDMMRPVTKWNTRIEHADMVAEAVRKAFKLAEAEKPGATHLEFPENVAHEECRADNGLFQVRKVRRPAPDYKAVGSAIDLIRKARKPLILAGNGAIRKRATTQLRRFLEQTGIAVCNTFMGKGAASYRYPYNLYTIGLQSRDHVSCAFEEADLIITIGYDIVEYAPRFWNPDGSKTILHIDFEPAEVDYWYNPAVEVIGDLANTLWELNERAGEIAKNSGEFALKHRQNILADIHEFDTSTACPFKPQKILHDVRAVLSDRDILISDVGAHKIWTARMYTVHEPNTCIISNGFASMGIALPGGLAAKLACPDCRVLTISGDGAFMMNVQELETAVRLGVPTVNMIWTDGTFGLIEWHQEKKFGHAFGTRFGNPDFVKLAESFGAVGYRLGPGDDIQHVLHTAFAQQKPVVIDCPVDYSENIRLTQRLGNLVCPV